MKLKQIFISFDFVLSLGVAIAILWLPQSHIDTGFTKDLYNVGISVLSIIFSVFFAALAVLISAGDNEFLEFLQRDDHYTDLMWFFKATLFILFGSLVISVGLYAVTAMQVAAGVREQPKAYLMLFAFCFPYALIATACSVRDALRYADYRVRFMVHKEEERKAKNQCGKKSTPLNEDE